MDQKSLATLPAGYEHFTLWPEYHIEKICNPIFKFAIVETPQKHLEWRVWPFYFYEYRSEEEPIVDHRILPRGYLSVVIWRRPTHTLTKPRGWWRFSKRSALRTGFATVDPSVDYVDTWSRSAKGELKKWIPLEKSGQYSVARISWSDYKEPYLKSAAGKKIGFVTSGVLEKLSLVQPCPIEFLGVKKPNDSRVYAGMAIVTSKINKSAYYLAGFFSDDTRHDPLMAGLFDQWFRRSQESGIRFLQFGIFWQPGKPSSWKGYSFFKAKFGAQFLDEAPTLYKFKIRF